MRANVRRTIAVVATDGWEVKAESLANLGAAVGALVKFSIKFVSGSPLHSPLQLKLRQLLAIGVVQ